MKKLISYALGAAALLATSALAQDNSPDTYNDPNSGMNKDTARERKLDRPSMPKRVGLELQVGGGLEGFIDKSASAVAKPGGDWTARLIVGTRSHIGAEAAYVGTAQNLDTLGVSDRATLMSNGVEAVARLNLLTGIWQPYAIAGYSWRHYRVANTAVNTSSVADSDNVNAIPVGVGSAWRFAHLVADLRVTFQGAFGRELIPNANLSTLAANAKVGFEF